MLKKIQAASGLLFAVFLIAHLINTWAALAGPGVYEGVQRILGFAYQSLLLEALILGAILTHVTTAILRWRRERRGKLPWRARLHRYSGIFLMLVIAGHVTAVRVLPAIYGIRPGFDGVAFSVAFFPAFFYPYYLLLGTAGAYHVLNGTAVAAARLGLSIPLPPRWLYAGAGAAAVLTGVALLGFGGMLFEVADPWQSDFARLYQRLFSG